MNELVLSGVFFFKCNAGPAAFWLLGFLLTHPEAMEAVKSEIRGLRDTNQQHPAAITLLEAHSTPVLGTQQLLLSTYLLS